MRRPVDLPQLVATAPHSCRGFLLLSRHHEPTARKGCRGTLLNFFAASPAHWRQVRTTNVIERCFREVRCRTRPMSSFTNPARCDRIISGIISHLNRSWGKTPLKQFTQLC